jgi:glutamyl-Q tRNA(Asp) synthetase
VIPTFRFAPSPNGYLHLGHAYSAMLDHDLARACGGRFLLRIEDIDLARCRPEYEEAILDDLAWLGLAWEAPVRRQSEHFDAYADALARLEAEGLVYPAFESRAEIARLVATRERDGPWPRDPDGTPIYPGDAARMSREERRARIAEGAPYALRLDVEASLARLGPDAAALAWTECGGGEEVETPATPRQWGDVILARKDVPTSYHLAVVVDDALQGVTDVVRGRDLYAATSIHRLLQAVLGLPSPRYHHHRLILDTAGRKLSKSTGATALRQLRHEGATPDAIRAIVGLPAVGVAQP